MVSESSRVNARVRENIMAGKVEEMNWAFYNGSFCKVRLRVPRLVEVTDSKIGADEAALDGSATWPSRTETR